MCSVSFRVSVVCCVVVVVHFSVVVSLPFQLEMLRAAASELLSRHDTDKPTHHFQHLTLVGGHQARPIRVQFTPLWDQTSRLGGCDRAQSEAHI